MVPTCIRHAWDSGLIKIFIWRAMFSGLPLVDTLKKDIRTKRYIFHTLLLRTFHASPYLLSNSTINLVISNTIVGTFIKSL